MPYVTFVIFATKGSKLETSVLKMCAIVTGMETFGIWLLEEIDTRGWSMSELARRCGVTHAAISKIVSGDRNPSAKMCVSIARAFKMESEEVLRLAGLLPPKPPDSPSLEEAMEKFNSLPEWEQDLILAQMQMMIDRRKRGEAKDAPGVGEMKPGTATA